MDHAKFGDETVATLTHEGDPLPSPAVSPNQPPPLPKRPADSANKAVWVDYLVALGMDAGAEFDLTRTEMADLATRLGG